MSKKREWYREERDGGERRQRDDVELIANGGGASTRLKLLASSRLRRRDIFFKQFRRLTFIIRRGFNKWLNWSGRRKVRPAEISSRKHREKVQFKFSSAINLLELINGLTLARIIRAEGDRSRSRFISATFVCRIFQMRRLALGWVIAVCRKIARLARLLLTRT